MLKRWKKTETDAPPATHGSTALPAAPEARPAGQAETRRDRSQGKNAPTPRRKDQEAARRRTLVPEDRKAAAKGDRAAARTYVEKGLSWADSASLQAIRSRL